MGHYTVIEPECTITVYDGTVNEEVQNEVVALYREVYAEPPYFEGGDDFARFAEDLPKRVTQQSFRLVVARIDEDPLGFALGHRLPAPTRWWQGALTTLPADVVSEHPGRTFAIIEIAVCKTWRRRGFGRRHHAHLTADLSEERRTLLVRPDAKPAESAYLRWGYRKVGQVQPHLNAPIYNAMLAER